MNSTNVRILNAAAVVGNLQACAISARARRDRMSEELYKKRAASARDIVDCFILDEYDHLFFENKVIEHQNHLLQGLNLVYNSDTGEWRSSDKAGNKGRVDIGSDASLQERG